MEKEVGEAQSKVGWRLVDAVFETADYAFLSVEGTYSIVIPRDRLPETTYDSFMDTLRNYRGGAG